MDFLFNTATMENTIVAIILLGCTIMVGIILASTVMRCRSEKKNVFIFCLFAILFYIVGNFLEVTSVDTESAFSAIKITYVGGCFLSPLFLLFALDYCEVKLTRPLVLFLCTVSLLSIALVWTTEQTHLFYESFRFADEFFIHGLEVTEMGPLYYTITASGLIYITIALIYLIRRFRGWGPKYRKALVLITVFTAGPLVSDLHFIIDSYVLDTDLLMWNYTPFVLVITCAALYYSILRYDLFDFSSRAKSLTVDHSVDAVIVVDEEMNYSAANDSAFKLIPALTNISKGYPVTMLEGWPPELTDIDMSVAENEIAASGNREVIIDLPADRRDIGFDKKYMEANIQRFAVGRHVMGAVIILRDVTISHKLMGKLEEAAYTDGLTEIYNRRYFMKTAEMAFERFKRLKTPCCILILDLDHFKLVNDMHGHLAGDAVLHGVALNIRDTVRKYDVFARYGGEEFILLMDGATKENAVMLAERIRERVKDLVVDYEKEKLHITCSIGISDIRMADMKLDEALQRADAALYEAKNLGRNRVQLAS